MKKKLIDQLREFKDNFSWPAKDMLGILTGIIEHKLSISSLFMPIKQKKRSSTSERSKIIDQNVEKPVNAGMT